MSARLLRFWSVRPTTHVVCHPNGGPAPRAAGHSLRSAFLAGSVGWHPRLSAIAAPSVAAIVITLDLHSLANSGLEM